MLITNFKHEKNIDNLYYSDNSLTIYAKTVVLQENIISFLLIDRRVNPNIMTFVPEKPITRVYDLFLIECVRDYLYNRYLQDGSGFHSKDQCVEEIFCEVGEALKAQMEERKDVQPYLDKHESKITSIIENARKKKSLQLPKNIGTKDDE